MNLKPLPKGAVFDAILLESVYRIADEYLDSDERAQRRSLYRLILPAISPDPLFGIA
jgi:hypothetical protein